MSELDPALDTALQADGPRMFGAIEIVLPAATIRLLDGSGFLTLFGNTFVGHDPTYGALASFEPFNDGLDNTAPAIRMSMNVPTNTAVAAIADPDAQGGQVSVWVGAVNPQTGLSVSDPYLAFLGELDVATVQIGQNKRTVVLDVVSVFERFFDQDEGVRLNGPWHNSVWPGELGLQYIVAVQQNMPWGQDAPRPVLLTDMTPASSPGAVGGPQFGSYSGGGFNGRSPVAGSFY